MPKTVTLRIDDETYKTINEHAKKEKRPLSNFIEFAVKQYVQESEFTDDAETVEILTNKNLVKLLKRGSKEAGKRKGKFVN